jgi:hypothetical protein
MLRIIHNQTVSGALLIDDIDDGLPNKEVHRLGSTSDPKAYVRDGYANKVKQACYISYAKPTDATLPGYITVNQTPKVLLSAGKGKIAKMQTTGLITVVSLVQSDLNAPTISAAHLGVPGAGDLTLAGTNLLSVAPNITKVIITGSGAITLTKDQILSGGGSVSNTAIVIPAANIPGVALTTSSVKVLADDQTSSPLVITT